MKLYRQTMIIAACVWLCIAGCEKSEPDPIPPVHEDRSLPGEVIIAAGQRIDIGTPVVLWSDAGGYDAYQPHRHFDPAIVMPAKPADPDSPRRYNARLDGDGVAEVDREWELLALREVVDQFVIHYDACGVSRRCFEVLHDKRGLSAHFLLDVDGTIYQTLDLQERAWHAGSANDRSIGIEIANLGAYPNQDLLLEWYQPDETGWPMLVVPEPIGDPGLRLADFVARPSRRDMVHGEVQGEMLWQYDYTDAQYAALMKLTAGLARTFPRMVLEYPRAEDGSLRLTVLSDEEIDAFQGVLGHWHVSPRKVDPGPAFDWDRVIDGARAMFGQSQ